MLTPSAMAAEWLFAPYVGLTEQFTDNAFGTATDRDHDFITSLNSGFSLTGEGNRLQLAAEYDISYDFYARNDELNGFRHNLLASADTEIVDEHFFLLSQVAFTEETLSRSGNTSFVDRTVSSDRTRVLTTRISPYYTQDFGGKAVGLVQYTYSRVDFFETDVGAATTDPDNNQTHQINLSLGSGRDFTRTTWLVEAFGVDSQVRDGDDLKRATIAGSGQMPINKHIALIGSTGWDEFDAENVDNEDISGFFFGGGVRLTPGPRTDFAIQVGRRYGSGIVDMDLTYLVSSETTLTASYTVDITTAGQTLANIDVLDQDGELVNPNFVGDGYVDAITKAKIFTVGLRGVKGLNTYGGNVRYSQRDFLSEGTNDEVVTVDGRFARLLSPQLELAVSGGYSQVLDSEFVGGKDKIFYGSAALNYQFTADLSGSLSYGYFDRNSETSTSDLRENNISVSLRKAF
ncbi:MAG: TIGR03016 family PEP-CTERM system-associated outer membrane protein [Proteobacteria bacterium]|nr:TIGR03016 family PEP-CTERM system-associated outer membrane protein [Pseudomonadota bacterium]